MTRLLRPALSLFLLLSLITGGLYPLLVTGLAKAVFPGQAAGSLLHRDGAVVGSALIGQAFTQPRYVWGRPSATAERPYNGTASGGANLGPSNPALIEATRARIAALRAADPALPARWPVDLVTTSASGLDPHISIAAAQLQAARVARERHLPLATVQQLVAAHSDWPLGGWFGEPRVNVLQLNLALDAAERR